LRTSLTLLILHALQLTGAEEAGIRGQGGPVTDGRLPCRHQGGNRQGRATAADPFATTSKHLTPVRLHNTVAYRAPSASTSTPKSEGEG